MKKNDIAILVLIVSLSLGAAYFLGQSVLGGAKQTAVNVEKTEAMKAEVSDPDPRVFNSEAINPSVTINIGNSTNQQPFGE